MGASEQCENGYNRGGGGGGAAGYNDLEVYI